LLQAQTTYYIAPPPAGNDGTGVGTYELPWATLYKASTEATEWGDVIHVFPGTYNEPQRTVLAVGVSIVGENQYTTIINYTYNAGNITDAAIYAVSASVTDGNQNISYVTITGTSYAASRGIYTRYRNNFIIHHCVIKNFDKAGINADSEINWITMPASYTTGLEIAFCTIEDNTEFPDNAGECNLRWSGHSDFEIHHNTFTNTARVAGRSIYSSQVKNGSIHDNVLNTRESISGTWLFAMELFNCRGGVEIYNNTYVGGGTLDMSGHSTLKGIYDYSYSIHDNTFTLSSLVPYHDTPTAAITIEGWETIESVQVYRNHIKNFPWGINITMGVYQIWGGHGILKNLDIYSNIIENSASSDVSWNSFGIGLIKQATGITRRNINIINNTITGNQTNSYRGINLSVDGTNDDIAIKNNIIQGFDLGFLAENNSGTVDSLHLVNNLINDCASTVYIQTGVTSTNYVNTGQLTSDPLFTSSTNFHLQTGSPAAQTGVHIGTPYLLDYDGVPFLNPPSRGAYEVTSGTSIPTLTTTAITAITNTTASSGGYITSDGGAAVTARGVC
jgi:hypothetical protein